MVGDGVTVADGTGVGDDVGDGAVIAVFASSTIHQVNNASCATGASRVTVNPAPGIFIVIKNRVAGP
jgi:hypothetical protein